MKTNLTILILLLWFNVTANEPESIHSSLSETNAVLNDSTTIDTTKIHHVKEIDGHLVIQDSIIVEKIIKDVQTIVDQDERLKNIFAIFALCFSVIALIYTRQKQK
jgi:predicted P-loop ATPase